NVGAAERTALTNGGEDPNRSAPRESGDGGRDDVVQRPARTLFRARSGASISRGEPQPVKRDDGHDAEPHKERWGDAAGGERESEGGGGGGGRERTADEFAKGHVDQFAAGLEFDRVFTRSRWG